MVYFLVYYPRIHFHLANIRYGAIIVLERATSKWLALWCYEVTSGPIRWLLFLFAPDGVSQTEGCKHKAQDSDEVCYLHRSFLLSCRFCITRFPLRKRRTNHLPFYDSSWCYYTIFCQKEQWFFFRKVAIRVSLSGIGGLSRCNSL